jgi:proteic killer suppression protein
MIQSFGSKETEKVWEGIQSTKLPLEIQNVARRKLRMIHNSIDINDLRIPPSNHLKKMKGDLDHLYSIRINDLWRIEFIFQDGHAYEVEIVDYH